MLDHTDLLPTVREDLLHLSRDFSQPIDEGALRRSSPVLRRFIADGELQRAWKAAGFAREPVLEGFDLDAYLTGIDRNLVVSSSAGGATVDGRIIGPTLVGRFTSTDEEYARRYAQIISASFRKFTLSEFSSSSALVTEGTTITRRQVVKYISNKLGGTHHDTKRDLKEDGLSFTALDYVTKGRPIQIADKTPVYFELLAIGQAFGKSKDLQRLVESIQGGHSRR